MSHSKALVQCQGHCNNLGRHPAAVTDCLCKRTCKGLHSGGGYINTLGARPLIKDGHLSLGSTGQSSHERLSFLLNYPHIELAACIYFGTVTRHSCCLLPSLSAHIQHTLPLTATPLRLCFLDPLGTKADQTWFKFSPESLGSADCLKN